MDKNSAFERHDRKGRLPKTWEALYRAGDIIIQKSMPVRKICVLAQGTIRIETDGAMRAKIPLRTTFTCSNTDQKSWAILGPLFFFDRQLSDFNYRAVTDCTVLTFDSRMFATRKDRLETLVDLAPIAKTIVCNSDLSHRLIPNVARAMGIDAPDEPTFGQIVHLLRIMHDPDMVEDMLEQAFHCVQRLIQHREDLADQPSLIATRAMMPS